MPTFPLLPRITRPGPGPRSSCDRKLPKRKVMGLGAKSGRDRRKFPRVPYASQAQLVLCPGGARSVGTPVEVVDFSRQGIGIRSSEALVLGAKYVVREPNVTTQGGSVIYTVVRAERLADGAWTIGLQVSNTVETTTDETIKPHRETRVRTAVLIVIGVVGLAAAWW